MKVNIVKEGSLCTFHYSRSGKENLGRFIFFVFFAGLALMIFLITAIVPAEILAQLLLFATGGFILLIGLLFLFFSGLKDLVINSADRTCMIGNKVYNIPDSSKIVLDRNYTIVGSGKSRRQAVVWNVSIKDAEGSFQSIHRYTGTGNQFSCPWIDETAETIAELLQITLEDSTGNDLEVRHPGETDTPLAVLLSQRGADIGDTAPLVPVELQDRLGLEFTDNGYELFTEHIPISLKSYVKVITGLILAGIGLTFDLFLVFFGYDLWLLATQQYEDSVQAGGPIMVALWYTTIAFLAVTIIGFINLLTILPSYSLLTSLTRTTIIDFNRVDYNRKEICLKDKGLIVTKNKGKMLLDSVEKLIIVQKWSEKHTVEFVGDDKRLQLPGEYNLDEAGLLLVFITHILVQMGK